MERHQPSGQFSNWYDHRSGAKLTTWPPTGEPLTPILSSVDNGWLATGLQLVAPGVPELSARAGTLFTSYDTIVSESRIASYLGIAKGEIPQRHYFGTWRSFPDSCDWSWQETRPVGFQRTYFGVGVFDGAYATTTPASRRHGVAACSRR